jgi:hypothetical protein
MTSAAGLVPPPEEPPEEEPPEEEPPEEVTTKLQLAVFVSAVGIVESVTRKTTESPAVAVVGVPEIVPPDRVNPPGRVPLERANV